MRLERILAIVMLLLGRTQVGCQELAERFEVSLRTIYRDIEAINAAGIPVWSAPGVGGGVGIMPQYKLEKRIFTSGDVLALLESLGFARGAVATAEIAPALAKVESLFGGQGGGALVFDPSAWMGVDTSGAVGLLHGAIHERQRVAFHYLGQKGTAEARQVEPMRLLFKHNSWYLQGHCLARKDVRLFKLARMWNLTTLPEHFEKRPLPEIPDVYSQGMQARSIEVRLLVRPAALDRMLEYVTAQQLVPTQGGYLVDFRFVPDDFGYGLLLSFGAAVECVQPAAVRKELGRRLEEIRQIYT